MEKTFDRFTYRTNECDSYHYRKNLLLNPSFDNQEIHFYDFGEVRCKEKGEQPLPVGENNETWVLHFIVSGTARYRFSDQTLTVKKGHFIVIPPHQSCHVRTIPPEKLHLYKLILLDTSSLRMLLARLEKEKCVFIRENGVLYSIFQEMTQLLEKPSTHVFRDLAVLVYRIIAEVSRQGLDYESRLTVQSICQELECWPEHTYSLPDIAAKCGLSLRSFERQFKEVTNCSFQRYLIHCRIGNACRMLKNTSYTLSEIATINNFHSTAYFCRMFKLLTGTTPGSFRGAQRYGKHSGVSSVAALNEGSDKHLSANRKNILWHILQNNSITIDELSRKTSLHRSAVQKNLEYLKKKGYIIRHGPRKNGYWQISREIG
ncbi:MAG: helix-turn-helix domain-containing protein [Lentisphaeria bacterium]|nr:helix-turn-helix domain-containing protein [Lentisphaeria bacterium]